MTFWVMMTGCVPPRETTIIHQCRQPAPTRVRLDSSFRLGKIRQTSPIDLVASARPARRSSSRRYHGNDRTPRPLRKFDRAPSQHPELFRDRQIAIIPVAIPTAYRNTRTNANASIAIAISPRNYRAPFALRPIGRK